MDNLYPDRTNSKFDIKYARRLMLGSDIHKVRDANINVVNNNNFVTRSDGTSSSDTEVNISGGGTNYFKPLKTFLSSVSNVGTSTEYVNNYTIPAGTFANDGDRIIVKFYVQFSGGGTNVLGFRFANVVTHDGSVANVTATQQAIAVIEFMRTSSSTLQTSTYMMFNFETYQSVSIVPLTGYNFAVDTDIKLALTGWSAGSIAISYETIDFIAAPDVTPLSLNPVPYKIYSANLSQSGTGAPTAIEAPWNTLTGIVWTRIGTGLYQGTLAGAFPDGKTFITTASHGTTYLGFIVVVRNTDDVISIFTTNPSASQIDNALDRFGIEIKVAP